MWRDAALWGLVFMARGGARNRSGPAADPESGRSERRGFKLDALPSSGFDGDAPEFPLPPSANDAVIGERELAIWELHWTYPQACAWSLEPQRWEQIAEFCRIKAIVELDPGASAALVDKLRQYRDQLGLTPAGLRENGWKIAVATVEQEAKKEERRSSGGSRDRVLRVAK
jgi:hypothetical protein